MKQFVIFNPWKGPWNWIVFYQNSFVISPGFLYHLISRDSGGLASEAFTSNPTASSKQCFNGLKITNGKKVLIKISQSSQENTCVTTLPYKLNITININKTYFFIFI